MNAADTLAGRLAAFLQAEVPQARNILIENLTPITGGNARQAWSFDAAWMEGGTPHRAGCLMLSKVEAGQLETDLAPEFFLIRALQDTGVPIPRALWLDADGARVGHPSFVMERVPGAADIVALLRPETPETSRAVALDLAQAAARLHAVDWRARGVDFLPPADPATVARDQVAIWESLFLRHRMEPLPALAHAFRWLNDHAPVAERVAIVHGDLRFGNFLYEGMRINALLDWEMAHLGDPVEDLAWVYHPLWSPERHLPLHDFVAAYEAASGAPVPPDTLRFYRLFTLIKHAVISLTGARSFHDRRARNVMMADRMVMAMDCVRQFFEMLPERAGAA